MFCHAYEHFEKEGCFFYHPNALYQHVHCSSKYNQLSVSMVSTKQGLKMLVQQEVVELL